MSVTVTVAEIQNDEKFSFANIQPEILENILEYLTWYDKQTCRLVCRSWYHNTNLKKFTTKLLVKFTMDTFNSSSDLMKWYLKNMDLYPNLYLNDVDFSVIDCNEYLDLWKQIGPGLDYLKIKDCGIALERLKLLFPQLLNISTLAIDGIHSVTKDPLEEQGFDYYYLNIEEFEPNTLGEMPVRLDKLKRFMYNYNLILSDCMFECLTNMMPNLEVLHIIRHCETPPEDMDISWGKLYEFIKRQSGKLKSLAIHGWAVKQESLLDMTQLNDFKLEELDISVNYYYADNDAILNAFLKQQTQLKSLKLHSWAVSNGNFEVICDYLKNLETLVVESYTITDDVIPNLSKLKKLKNLCLNGQPVIYEALVDGILRTYNNKLESLELVADGSPNIFFDSLFQLVNLKSLNLYNSECYITDRDVNVISKHMLRLESFSIKHSKFTDQAFIGTENENDSISNLTRLYELCLYKLDSITDKSCYSISKLSNLRILNLTGAQITTAGLQLIVENCSQIRELRLIHCKNITEAGYFMMFDQLPKLKHLLIDKELRDHLSSIKPDLIAKHFKNALCLNGYEIVYDFLVDGILYPNNKSLLTLELVATGSPKLFFDNLFHLRNLKILDLYNCECLITDCDINIVAVHVLQLEKLAIAFTQFTDQAFIGTVKGNNALSNLTKLMELRILKLDAVTDKSCIPISKLQNLRFLNLTGSQISDEGIQRIVKNCTNLEELRISNCKQITEVGYVAIFENLPRLARLFCGKRQKNQMNKINLDIVANTFKNICRYDYDRTKFGKPPLDD